PIEKSAPGKLTRFSHPRERSAQNLLLKHLQKSWAAVRLKLDHVFTRVRMRSSKIDEQAFVEHRTRCIHEVGEIDSVGRRRIGNGRRPRPSDGKRSRSGQAKYSYPAGCRGRRGRDDGEGQRLSSGPLGGRGNRS